MDFFKFFLSLGSKVAQVAAYIAAGTVSISMIYWINKKWAVDAFPNWLNKQLFIEYPYHMFDWSIVNKNISLLNA